MKVIPVMVPKGANPIKYLVNKIKSEGLVGGFVIGIGTFKRAKIGILKNRTYDVKEVRGKENYMLEVTSLLGNYMRVGEDVSIHLHVTLTSSHDEALGGHLVEAEVGALLEVALIEVGDLSEVFAHRVKST